MALHLSNAEWRLTRRLTLALLSLWLMFNLLEPWFARALNAWQIMGFPLGFWLAAQGSLWFYLLLIAAYVIAMDRFERRAALPDVDCPETVNRDAPQ